MTADVFTPVPFSGNQLAIVFGAEGLPTETLQAITREFNYAESTFVMPAEDARTAFRVRIFTPEMEVPFAGHPTIGTAHVLVATGKVPATSASVLNLPHHDGGGVHCGTGEVTVVLGENVGPVPVVVRTTGGIPVHARLTTAQLPEERAEVSDFGTLAAVVGLCADDLPGGSHEPIAVSCGLPFQIIPVRTTEAVSRARLDRDLWQSVLSNRWAPWPMVFAMTHGETDDSLPSHVQGCDIRARVFVPGSSVPEDPATGSANAALAGYLAARTPGNGHFRWEVAQGLEIGRPSRLSIEADKTEGTITGVHVGGATVIMCEGMLTLH